MTTTDKWSRKRWIAEQHSADIKEYDEYQPSLKGREKRLPIYTDGTLEVCVFPTDSKETVERTLEGRHCLDLFAGSGVLGIEAASRGAMLVDLVEQNPKTFTKLRENTALFADSRLRPVRADALEFAASAGRQARHYDLVMLDPPYRQGWLERVAPLLPALARPGMRIYAEAEQPVAALGDWRTLKQGKAGQVFYHLLEQA